MPETEISVVMNTLNAEAYLGFALASVTPWATETVVVDMHSDDRTREIAERAGARFVLHEKTLSVVVAREFAVAQAKSDWVFVLDADEMVPAPLATRLQEAASRGGADVYRVLRKNYLLGELLRGSGWGPEQDRQIRLFRKGSVRFPGIVHHDFEPTPDAILNNLPGTGGEALIHFNYLGVSDFIVRLNRYTDLEAKRLVDENRARSRLRIVRNAYHAFTRRYYKQGGKADGWAGFYLCLMMAFYSLAAEAKAAQLRAVGDEQSIRDRYLRVAQSIVDGYTH